MIAAPKRPFKIFDITLGLFVAVLLISNVLACKIAQVGPFTFDGATILFPLVYIFGDVFTEVYGFKGSRRAVWTAFAAQGLMALAIWAVGALKPAVGWENQQAFNTILMFTPRIALASVVAFFCGEYVNSVVLSVVKVKMRGKALWVRTILSTLFGEFFDTLLFVTLAFYGVFPNSLIWAMLISNYVFKVGFEICATPITYAVVKYFKRTEGIDTFDYNETYNPMSVEV